MNIVIRADASVHIGSGHIMRCLVLAQALTSQGHSVCFASRPQRGDLIDFVRGKGFTVYELVSPPQWLTPQHSADYQAWLQVSWQEDADSFLEQVADADLLIIDHYALNKEWQVSVQQRLSCKVFVIDDLVRQHQADLILDQTLLREAAEYQQENPTAKILTGCEFALLNPLFSRYREQALEGCVLSTVPTVLLSMGGIDQPNATLSVLEALALHPKLRPQVTVLLGKQAPHYIQVKAFVGQHNSWAKHIDFVDNMAELMLQHDVAIGAPGSSAWERACLGIPSVIVPLAENQHAISQNLVSVNAAMLIELDGIPSSLVSAYQCLLENWLRYRDNNLVLCDGLGVWRVLDCIHALFETSTDQINVRVARQSDIAQVYEWQCQPETRKYALNTATPNWDEHRTWMSKKLQTPQNYFYILVLPDNSGDVGVVRLDRVAQGEYIVSIFVDPAHYGKGIAKQALAYVDSIHGNVTIHATVLEENTASQRLFTAANYRRVSGDAFIRSPIV